MPQYSEYKNKLPMGMKSPNLRLDFPVAQDSLYAKSFDIGMNIAKTLSGSRSDSAWDRYLKQSESTLSTLKQFPVQSAGALLLHRSAKSRGIGLSSDGISFGTKYGQFDIQKMDGGVGIKFDLDTSLLQKLERRLMK